MKRIAKKILFLIIPWILLFPMPFVNAQIPQDIPHQTDPVDFSSPGNILFYIGVPLLMLVLYLMIRKSRRKKNEP